MITSFLYRKNEHAVETNVSRAGMAKTLRDKDALLWVDIENPTEFESEMLVEIFNFHPLTVEDCVTDISQPKVDDYEEYLFLVMHAIGLDEKQNLKTTELDIFLGTNYVLTFHKDPVKCVSQLRDLGSRKPEFIFGQGPDLLTYQILDRLMDDYNPSLNHYEEKIDALEDEIFNHPSQDYLVSIMQTKRDVFHFRRIVAPQRDTLNHLTRNPSAVIHPKNMMYFRDVYDHLFRIYGIIDGFHEALNGILQAYFSFSSNKLNEIMKRMTVLATLTMPTVMIASIYGMNFHNIPELEHPYGYFIALGVMGVVSVAMLIWMKWKRWL